MNVYEKYKNEIIPNIDGRSTFDMAEKEQKMMEEVSSYHVWV